MYIYINSNNHSTNLFPKNSANSFKIRLPEVIELCGRWKVGVVDIQLPTFSNSQYNTPYLDLCTPVCQESIDGQSFSPILKRIYRRDYLRTKITFNPICYVDISTQRLDYIEFYIQDTLGEAPPFSKDLHCYLTLHLIQY